MLELAGCRPPGRSRAEDGRAPQPARHWRAAAQYEQGAYRAPGCRHGAPGQPSATAAARGRAPACRGLRRAGAAAAGGNDELQKEYIYNLQRGASSSCSSSTCATRGAAAAARPADALRAGGGRGADLTDRRGASYLKIEDEYKAKLAAEELRQQQLREEALASATHERRTQEEKAKALAQLQLVRDTCSSEKQELQGEVTALQRELERCYLAEKTARAQFGAQFGAQF